MEAVDGKSKNPGVFLTTQWTMVLSARAGSLPQAGEALSRLCRIYWRPVYHFIRLHGVSVHDAEDYTQGFFEALIEKDYLRTVDPNRGRFRSFLMAAAKHFLSDQFDKKRAWKRGGRTEFVPLDLPDAEGELKQEVAAKVDPESAFDRAWALTVLERAVSRLQQFYRTRGKETRFEVLRPFLVGEGHQSYHEISLILDVSVDVVKTEVRRMRKSFRSFLRDEVRETLGDPEDLDAEIRYLGSLMGS